MSVEHFGYPGTKLGTKGAGPLDCKANGNLVNGHILKSWSEPVSWPVT